jgi:hypothetical protein
MLQAGDYSAITHTLKAMHAVGVPQAKASGKALIAQMKAMPVEDEAYGKGSIRADGRVMNPMYLFQVKAPEESRYPWDYYRLVRTVSAEDAFWPSEALATIPKTRSPATTAPADRAPRSPDPVPDRSSAPTPIVGLLLIRPIR